MTGKIGLITQLFFRSYQICTTTHCKLRSYFGLWESRNLLLILGVFHFWKLGKNSTNLNHHFSSIFKGTMAWISINTKLFQTQIWLEKWYENGEILHFVSSFENGLRARSCEWPGRSILNILKSINKKIVWWMNRTEG